MKLLDCYYQVINVPVNSDVTIVHTFVTHAYNSEVIVIGEDTNLLVISWFISSAKHHSLHFISESKQNTLQIMIRAIHKTKKKLGKTICNILSVIHACTGCNIVSHIFAVLKSFMSS